LNKKNNDNSLAKMKSAGPLIGIGSQLAVTMAVFVLAGKYIDDKNDSSPLFILIFSFLGIIIGIYGFIKTILSINKKPPEK